MLPIEADGSIIGLVISSLIIIAILSLLILEERKRKKAYLEMRREIERIRKLRKKQLGKIKE